MQNRFYVRGEGNYLYQYNYGSLAADPRLAAQNFINALGTIEPTLEKFRNENEKLTKDIPILREVVDGTWRKEPELAALRNEFKELDRKIQLSLKPIEESEGQPINDIKEDKKQSSEDSRQPYVPARLREIANNSDGRVVIGTVGGSSPKIESPASKGIKL